MKREEAIDKFVPTRDTGNDIYVFIDKLYYEGYLILTPEDLKKVEAMTVLAEVHGMNPFKPKE